jgi:hypothetical protein
MLTVSIFFFKLLGTNSHLQAKTLLKNQFFTQKICLAAFRPLFGRFSAAFPQKWRPSSANNFFLTAGFELFCRIFGLLASVIGTTFSRLDTIEANEHIVCLIRLSAKTGPIGFTLHCSWNHK